MRKASMPYTMFRSRKLLAAAVFVLGAMGCTQEMADQPRYDPYDPSEFFSDKLSARQLPAGTVSRSSRPREELLDSGTIGGQLANQFPFPVTKEVLDRGRQRFNIYCTPCHGLLGTGNGMIALRGFRRLPASFHSERLRTAPHGHFFDVITNGFGAMPRYSYQVKVNDRWAIVAYIRALQLSQWAPADAVPPDELQKLQSGTR